MIRAALIALGLGAAAGSVHADALAFGRHLAAECAGCHRSDGAGTAIPALAGRPEGEIIALLEDFRAGRKTNPVMESVARSLSAEESAALAAYFSSLPKPVDAAPLR